MGRATQNDCIELRRIQFQSTLSVGRATDSVGITGLVNDISIHALRGESDGNDITFYERLIGFQSTLSVGRATKLPAVIQMVQQFQSTLSVGRATYTDVSKYNW